ncbi:unnamed protein product [Paramecium pentaurelia]|uniref:Uncharacterized protein n=1 Tax=Paramecium pentaurelia TaxID=43138 RepID=A0A8S1SMX9_9CILI|nr:unnamed protein product [Paramecium pentaurelia]
MIGGLELLYSVSNLSYQTFLSLYNQKIKMLKNINVKKHALSYKGKMSSDLEANSRLYIYLGDSLAFTINFVEVVRKISPNLSHSQCNSIVLLFYTLFKLHQQNFPVIVLITQYISYSDKNYEVFQHTQQDPNCVSQIDEKFSYSQNLLLQKFFNLIQQQLSVDICNVCQILKGLFKNKYIQIEQNQQGNLLKFMGYQIIDQIIIQFFF